VSPLETPVLGRDALDAVADLCNRSLSRPLRRADLDGALFAADQPTVLRGDPAIGVVAAVPGEPGGSIRLLVVDPAHRGNGHGHTLLVAAQTDLARSTVITVGADAPYYLFPGVETSEIEMLSLLESHRYQREEANFNMSVDLTRLPPDPGGTLIATAAERDEVAGWMDEHWANWTPEVLRALDHGSLLLARGAPGMTDSGITGFCAWNVNRGGLLGPIASRPDLIGRGIGRPLLLGALHRMAAAAQAGEPIEISWVGPIVPYAAIGCRVSRVFFVYRKRRK
jgi:GNAT superfamily N-acetyltransferase